MTPEDYAFLGEFLRRRSGLSITSEKAYLIESRLKPVAGRHGFRDVEGLVRELKSASESVCRAVTDAMTTNETFFFRDRVPFDQFRDVMVQTFLNSRLSKRRIRIWCAGCSTGQEPYSLAMVVDGLPHLIGWTVEIVASDINSEVIARAKEGIYNQFEVQRGLPIQMLVKHLQQEGNEWRISEAIKRRVQFRVFNLLDAFAGLGPFDIIFCRNVLIYFDQKTKQDVMDRLSRSLADDGYLVLGSAETVLGLGKSFTPMESARGIYRKSPKGEGLRTAAMG
jgi:chemotaxis protein methyltransferase CheR